MTTPAPRTITFSVEGPIARSDLAWLSARVCALLERSRADLALCDVRSVEPDAVTVEALARLQLAAQRHGCRVHVLHASRELVDLVAFMGLRDVLTHEVATHRAAPAGRTAGTAARSRGRR